MAPARISGGQIDADDVGDEAERARRPRRAHARPRHCAGSSDALPHLGRGYRGPRRGGPLREQLRRRPPRCSRRASASARSSPKRSTSETASMRSPDVVEHLAGDRDDRHAGLRGQRGHPADHLALEALRVEEALGGDHEVGPLDAVVELDLVGDQVEARHQAGTGGGQPAGQAAGGAGALELADVDAVLGPVHLGQALEAAAEQLHLGRRGALLGREHLGGVDEPGADVAGHQQLDALEPAERVEGPEGGQAAVGGGRAADARRSPAWRRRRGRWR